jgi:hypothetical protein
VHDSGEVLDRRNHCPLHGLAGLFQFVHGAVDELVARITCSLVRSTMSVKVASRRSSWVRNTVVEALTLSATVSSLGRSSVIISCANWAVGMTLVRTSSASNSTLPLVLRIATYMPQRIPAWMSTANAVTTIKTMSRVFIRSTYFVQTSRS